MLTVDIICAKPGGAHLGSQLLAHVLATASPPLNGCGARRLCRHRLASAPGVPPDVRTIRNLARAHPAPASASPSCTHLLSPSPEHFTLCLALCPTLPPSRTHLLFDISEKASNTRMVGLSTAIGGQRTPAFQDEERTIGYVGKQPRHRTGRAAAQPGCARDDRRMPPRMLRAPARGRRA